MNPVFTLKRNGITASVRAYAAEMKLGLREAAKATMKGITRYVIDYTPPGSAGSTGRDAYNAGRAKIANQMNAVMAPVKIKGRRKITQVFGRRLKRPVYVQTREHTPDVAGFYRGQLKARAGGIGFSLKNFTGRKTYVDVRKFQTVLRERQAKVGTLAAGWSAVAGALDLPIAAWVSRHGQSGGAVRIDLAGDRMAIVASNYAYGLPAALRSELAQTIVKAVEYQKNTMERAIAGYHERTKRKLAIR